MYTALWNYPKILDLYYYKLFNDWFPIFCPATFIAFTSQISISCFLKSVLHVPRRKPLHSLEHLPWEVGQGLAWLEWKHLHYHSQENHFVYEFIVPRDIILSLIMTGDKS